MNEEPAECQGEQKVCSHFAYNEQLRRPIVREAKTEGCLRRQHSEEGNTGTVEHIYRQIDVSLRCKLLERNEHLVVMQAIGNGMANRIWEHNASARDRPTPEAGHAQKEQWIRRKYEDKLFLPPIPVDRTLAQQLVDAVLGRNVKQLLLMVLPRCTLHKG